MRWAARAGALGWALTLFLLSARPGTTHPQRLPHVDKVAHLGAYSVLGGLLTLSAPAHWTARRAWVSAATFAAAYGATDEYHQSFVPGRTPELGDWIADALGGMLGALVTIRLTGGDT